MMGAGFLFVSHTHPKSATLYITNLTAHPREGLVRSRTILRLMLALAISPLAVSSADAQLVAGLPTPALVPSSQTRPTPTVTGEKTPLAVLDLETHEGIDAGVRIGISDRVRYALSKTGKYRITTRSSMESMLKEQDFQQSGRCDELACIVQVGKIVGVKKMVAGRVAKMGSLYQISLQLIDVESAVVENEVIDSCNCNAEGLLRLAEEQAFSLAGLPKASASHDLRAGSASRKVPAGQYWSSKMAGLFHRADCARVNKIKPISLVIYKTREDAIAVGRKPCRDCQP
jgi:TolB-like protein